MLRAHRDSSTGSYYLFAAVYTSFVRHCASELHFLARRANVARLAEPAVGRQLERAFVLVAEERAGFAAPVATDHVRISERRIVFQKAGGDFLFVRDQIIAPQHFSRGRSDGLSVHEILRGRRQLRGLSPEILT